MSYTSYIVHSNHEQQYA